MKNRMGIWLIVLLVIFFVSIDDPMVHVGAVLRRLPDLDDPPQVACIRKAVPENIHLFFFSKRDGTVDWNADNFMITRVQYYLAPKIVDYLERGPIDVENHRWFLAYNLDASFIDQFAYQYHLQILQTCGNMVVLSKANG